MDDPLRLAIEDRRKLNPPRNTRKISDLLRDALDFYGRMANSAYSETDEVAKFGRVVFAHKKAAPNFPVFYVVETEANKQSAVMVIRGTDSLEDMATNLEAVGVFWRGIPYGRVHEGMAIAAQNIFDEVISTLRRYHHITVVGHSLGGGVGTYLTLLLQKQGKNARCFAFGAPPTLERRFAFQVKNIYSMIHGYDIVPRLSLHSMGALLNRATKKVVVPGREPRLYSAGTIILKVKGAMEMLSARDARRRPDILISRFMFTDHKLKKYMEKTQLMSRAIRRLVRPFWNGFGALGRRAKASAKRIFGSS